MEQGTRGRAAHGTLLGELCDGAGERVGQKLLDNALRATADERSTDVLRRRDVYRHAVFARRLRACGGLGRGFRIRRALGEVELEAGALFGALGCAFLGVALPLGFSQHA